MRPPRRESQEEAGSRQDSRLIDLRARNFAGQAHANMDGQALCIVHDAGRLKDCRLADPQRGNNTRRFPYGLASRTPLRLPAVFSPKGMQVASEFMARTRDHNNPCLF